MGDFSFLKQLPDMYRHCKLTEDKDLNALDFITDHLVNIDGLFDHHDHGDEQKPHQPIQSQHPIQGNIYISEIPESGIEPLPTIKKEVNFPEINLFVGSFSSEIFRPPIVA